MPGREYELGDLARLPRILYEAFQERRSVDIRNKPRHEAPTIQQTSISKPSVSKPYSRTLPALPRPRYCIGLVGTEQEKQALQKERLTKFMIQQATGRRFASCSGSFEGCWGVLPIDSGCAKLDAPKVLSWHCCTSQFFCEHECWFPWQCLWIAS